ncbi:MAG: hypothetical protein AAF871_04330 [Pseudomonadota bacterium]
MFPFIFSPTIEYPLSGDVVQDIAPVVSWRYVGIPEVEDDVYCNVASPGKQLGKLCDAVLLLAETAGLTAEEHEAIRDLEEIAAGVKASMERVGEQIVARADAMAVKAERFR